MRQPGHIHRCDNDRFRVTSLSNPLCSYCEIVPAAKLIGDSWLCEACGKMLIAESLERLEQDGLVMKTGQIRNGRPVYVAVEDDKSKKR